MGARGLSFLGAALVVLISARMASALKCSQGHEALHLKLVSVTVDGVEQRPSPDERILWGDSLDVTLEDQSTGNSVAFTSLTECGAYTDTYNIQPAPPADGAPCAHEGLHCHWPDVAELCGARCSGGVWHPTGCSTDPQVAHDAGL